MATTNKLLKAQSCTLAYKKIKARELYFCILIQFQIAFHLVMFGYTLNVERITENITKFK